SCAIIIVGGNVGGGSARLRCERIALEPTGSSQRVAVVPHGPTPGNQRCNVVKPFRQRTHRRRRCWRRSRRECRPWLHLQGTDVDTPVEDPIITRTALIIQRRWSEIRIARIDGWAAGKKPMGKGGTAVVLERPEQWVGIDLIADRVQEATAVIAAEVVAM